MRDFFANTLDLLAGGGATYTLNFWAAISDIFNVVHAICAVITLWYDRKKK